MFGPSGSLTGVSVDKVESLVGLCYGGVFERDHAVAQLAGDAELGGACARDDDALVNEAGFGGIDGGHDRCERDCACALTASTARAS